MGIPELTPITGNVSPSLATQGKCNLPVRMGLHQERPLELLTMTLKSLALHSAVHEQHRYPHFLQFPGGEAAEYV